MQEEQTAERTQRELQSIARQCGLLIGRYDPAADRISRMYGGGAGLALFPAAPAAPAQLAAQRVLPESRACFLRLFAEIRSGKPEGGCNVQLQAYGSPRWNRLEYTRMDGQNGPWALLTAQDNTEQQEQVQAAEKWHARMSSLLEGSLLYAEINLTADTVEQIRAKNLREIPLVATLRQTVALGAPGRLDAETRRLYRRFFDPARLLRAFEDGKTSDTLDYGMELPSGEKSWRRASIGMVRYPHSGDVMLAVVFSEASDQHKVLEQLTHCAFHDPLTGALNRAGVSDRAARVFDDAPDKLYAMFSLDLDDFKQINDRMGHQSGDLVLRQAGAVLRQTFRSDDIVGRFGGDEFVVLIAGRLTPEFLERKARELLRSMYLETQEGEKIPFSVSIGIAFGREDVSFDKLYRLADRALYAAKREGKNCFHLVNADTCQERAAVLDAGGEQLSLQDVLRDSRKTSGALPGSGSRRSFGMLLGNLPGGVAVLDADAAEIRILSGNSWLQHFTGAATVLDDQLKVSACIVPGSEAAVRRNIALLHSGAPHLSVVLPVRKRDGGLASVLFQANAVERRAGHTVYYAMFQQLPGAGETAAQPGRQEP